MKKIPTVFVREFSEHKITAIKPEFTNEECKDAFYNGEPTVKIDGAACMVKDGKLYRRFDFGKADKLPVDRPIIFCQEKPDEITGHFPAWLLCSVDDPADKWFLRAYENYFSEWEPTSEYPRMNGTYEAIGPHFQGNPYGLDFDTLSRHGSMSLSCYIPKTDGERVKRLQEGDPGTRCYARTFDGVREFLKENRCEGIVFWKDGKPVCKIKRSDFGFPWGGKG